MDDIEKLLVTDEETRKTFKEYLVPSSITEILSKYDVQFNRLLMGHLKSNTENVIRNEIYQKIMQSLYITVYKHGLMTKNNLVVAFTDACIELNHIQKNFIDKRNIERSFFGLHFMTSFHEYTEKNSGTTKLLRKNIYHLIPDHPLVKGYAYNNVVFYIDEERAIAILLEEYVDKNRERLEPRRKKQSHDASLDATGGPEVQGAQSLAAKITPPIKDEHTTIEDASRQKIKIFYEQNKIPSDPGRLQQDNLLRELERIKFSDVKSYNEFFNTKLGKDFLNYPYSNSEFGMSENKVRRIVSLIKHGILDKFFETS